MGNGPDFMICVGATKAGTTWLHDQLSAHPECYLRTIKEYHYFSTNGDAQWAKLIGDTRAEIEQLSGLPDDALTEALHQRLDDLTSTHRAQWAINPALVDQHADYRRQVIEAKQRQLNEIYALSPKEKPKAYGNK